MFTLNGIYDRLKRKTASTHFIPQIDGMRFLAVMLVVMFHIHGFVIDKVPFTFSGHPFLDYWWFFEIFGAQGRKGVLIFFVISGFILALPFAKNYWQEAKKVELKKYFLRRLTRLEPPYIITMVACCFLLLLFGRHDFAHMFPNFTFLGLLPNLAASLVYLHNFFYPWVLSVNSVAWSLEVEVQFYVLVPLLVLVLKLPKLYRRISLGLVIVLFTFLQHLFPAPIFSIYSFIQYFLLGFLLVDLYLSGWKLKLNWLWSLLSGCAILLAILYVDIDRSPYYELFFIAAVFGLFVLALTNDAWKKIFSLRPLTSIGGMCYSIYLWHTSIISGAGNFTVRFNFTHSYPLTILWQFALLFPIILLFSACFYLVIEQPCMDKDWPVKLWNFVSRKP